MLDLNDIRRRAGLTESEEIDTDDELWERGQAYQQQQEAFLTNALNQIKAGIESVWVDPDMRAGTAEIRIELYDGLTIEQLAKLSELGAVTGKTRLTGDSTGGGLLLETTVRLGA